MSYIRAAIRQWKRGVKSGKATTVASAPFIVGAIIQILYSFDMDPNTHTDANTLVVCALTAFGFAGTPGEDKNADK